MATRRAPRRAAAGRPPERAQQAAHSVGGGARRPRVLVELVLGGDVRRGLRRGLGAVLLRAPLSPRRAVQETAGAEPLAAQLARVLEHQRHRRENRDDSGLAVPNRLLVLPVLPDSTSIAVALSFARNR